MDDQSPKLNQQMSPDSSSATSSAGLQAGRSPSNWQDGPQMLLFGPDPALANRFRAQASAEDTKTNGTSGPPSTDLSQSAALQSALANKLAQRMDLNGSMEYSLTWKTRVTPAGRPICALRASALRISGNEPFGWPTATTGDTRVYSENAIQDWITGQTTNGHSMDLNLAAQLTGWPTPMMKDGENYGGVRNQQNPMQSSSLSQAVRVGLTGWPTPRREHSESTGAHRGTPDTLHSQTQLTGWATPTAGNHRSPKSNQHGKNSRPLQEQAGTITPSSTAETERPAASPVLNPAFSRWLMMFPVTWDICSPGFLEWITVQAEIDKER